MTDPHPNRDSHYPESVSTPPNRPVRLAGSAGSGTQIVNMIGSDIVSGVFAEGSRLPDEESMRRRYSVSRTALREAYSKLAAKGLIAARPKVGTSVRPKSAWNMLDPEVLTWHLQSKPTRDIAADLYALRRMVEPPAAALAAEIHDDEALSRIHAAYEDMIACKRREIELIDADLRFHLAILSATRNQFIGAFSALIHAAMVSTFRISWRGAEGILEERLLQHGEVAEAIASRDPALARARMEKLLDDSFQDVSEALGREPRGKPHERER